MISDILLNTIPLIRRVGDYQLRNFRSGKLLIDTKFNQNDVVTNIDRGSENMILQYIAEYYPAHSVISEESGSKSVENSEYTWIIDPLDGTANYSTGLPQFSISIALLHKGETVMGVVYAPYLNELFHAIKGEGAFLNGKQIRISDCSSLRLATVATGFPVDKDTNPDNNLDVLARVLPKVRAVRRLGSAAIDLCYVGAGFLDAYWEMNLHRWDIAAGELVLTEAGGIMEYYRNDRNLSILATTPGLIHDLSPLLENRQ